jgi:hypothetical protein
MSFVHLPNTRPPLLPLLIPRFSGYPAHTHTHTQTYVCTAFTHFSMRMHKVLIGVAEINTMQSIPRMGNGAVTHWKTPPRATTSSSDHDNGSHNSPEAVLSNIAFLQRMADAFEEQGNYAECVRSAESALLLRQANAATVEAALITRQQQQQQQKQQQRKKPATTTAAALHSTKHSDDTTKNGMVALTENGEVMLPLEIGQQAQEVVCRCNSYTVEALRHDQLDSAAFFLNHAMFLTDGDDDDVSDLRTALHLSGEGAAPTSSSCDRWWWRRVLQKQSQQSTLFTAQDSHAELKRSDAGDALDLAVDEGVSAGGVAGDSSVAATTTTATAAALRACFRDTPHDQQLRLRLRASTLNHLGCLEQRRGQLGAAVATFRMAIRTATLSAKISDSRTSTDAVAVADNDANLASAYLNLCTALNAMGRHAEAVQACERVVPLLQQALQEAVASGRSCYAITAASQKPQADDGGGLAEGDDTPSSMQNTEAARVATMLVVAYYNLGVSLERRDASDSGHSSHRRKPGGDGPKWAFEQAVQVSHAYHLVPASCSSSGIEAVMRALRDPHQQQQHKDTYGTRGNSGVAAEEQSTPPSQKSGQIAARGGDAVAAPPPVSRLPPRPPSKGSPARQPAQSLPRIAAVPAGSAAGPTQRLPRPPSLSSSSVFPSPPPPLAHTRGGCPPAGSSHPHTAAPLPSERRLSSVTSTYPVSSSSASRPSQHYPPMSSFTTSNAWSSPFAAAAPPAVLAPLSAGTGAATSATYSFSPTTTTPPPMPPAAIFAHSGDTNFTATAPPSSFARPTPPRFSPKSNGSGRNSGGFHAATTTAAAPASVNTFSRRTFGNPLPLPNDGSRGGRTSAATAMDGLGRAASARSTAAGTHAGDGTNSSGSARGVRGVRGRAAAGAAAAASTTSNSNATLTNEIGRPKQPKQQQQQLHTRSKRQKSIDRRQQREAAALDAALAEKVYQQLLSEKEKTEVERCRRAAVQIQRVWRGVLAREWVSTLMSAAVCLQRAVRQFLVKSRAEHARVAAEQARLHAEESARQEAACRVLQAHVRQFLRRLQIRREYRAGQSRLHHAARTIQRGYRAFCAQRAALLAAQAEANRREDEQRRFREKVAARRIQQAYLTYKAKRAELDAYQVGQRRIRSVVRIQAVVRGYLTRAWYAYYRVYRREQEVRSAAMQAKLVVLQSACRAICSAYYGQQRALQALLHMREVQRHSAATRIQCLWRCHVARVRRDRLQAEYDRDVRHATRIQRWYRMRTQRRAFLAWRAEQQRMRAATRLQRWVRACWQSAKAREFAAYHAELLRRQQLQRLQARAITVMQACANACVSGHLVASVRATFERNDAVARLWQRVGRGFAARSEMALERRAAYEVALQERETARHVAAARVIQRAWRCAAAKDKVESMRREVAAANVIARAYHVYRARVELAERRLVRRQQQEDAAARRIQQAVRGYLYGRRVKEMDAYYRAEHHKKMRRLRRAEAAVMIQSQWRGYVTRKVVQEERAVWQALSAAASVIQQAWRVRQARQQLRETLAQRIVERGKDNRAALTLQCFWRKIQAGRRVARLRQETRRRLVAVVLLQSWWRMQLAQREFACLRQRRREEAALEVYYAIQWERHATLINAFLRQRESGVAARHLLRQQLINQLTEEDRRRFLTRHEAATKIQALFRGHYERYYTRGLRAQAREEQRRAAELLARQQRAALTIQCAYRSAKARQVLAELQQAEFDRVQASHADYLESADPSEVVRELFWLHSTHQQREAALRRKHEAARRHDAASRIQRLYRCHHARRVVAAAHDAHQQERAARLLQDYWRHHRDVSRIKENQRRQAAATLLQSHIRGWIVRRGWPLYRSAIEAERQERVLVQDVLDHAAIVLQCFWRRVEAQRTAARLRLRRQEEHDARSRQEAAIVIQDAFRSYQRRKKTAMQ